MRPSSKTPIPVLLYSAEPPMDELATWLGHCGYPSAPLPGGNLAALGDGGGVLLMPARDYTGEAQRAIHARNVSTRRPWLVAVVYEGDDTLQRLDEAGLLGEVDGIISWPNDRPILSSCIARLTQRQLRLAELWTRRTNSQVLQDITSLLTSGVDLQLVLHDAMVRTVETLRASRAQVLTIIENQDIDYRMGDSDDAMAVWLPVPASRYPEIALVAALERALMLSAGEASLAGGAVAGMLQQRGLQGLAVIPLVWEREVFGALEVWFEQPAPFDDALRDVLRVAGAMIGQTIYKSELNSYLDGQEGLAAVSLAQGEAALPVLGKYREFFQRAFDGIFVVDRGGLITHINLAGEQISGYARRDLVGTALADIVVEHDRARLRDLLAEVWREGSARSCDLGLVTPAGDYVLVAVATSAVLAEDEVIVLSFRDITEARALENELRATKDFLERLIDSTVDAIIATDVQNTVILFNKGAERIFGMSAAEVISQMQLSMLFTEGESNRVISLLHSDEYGGPGRLEAVRTSVLNAEQVEVPVSLSASLLLEGGRKVGVVLVVSDLTERLQMERRLSVAQEKLVATEKQAAVAELAGAMAHELNQPLTSVMGYAELLARRASEEPTLKRATETILRETERMAEIVRKIGRITKYETKSYVGSAQILDLERSSE